MRALRNAIGAACVLVAFASHGQTYPSKPIRLVVPFTPGGPADGLARIVAPRLADIWGQQLVIDKWAKVVQASHAKPD